MCLDFTDLFVKFLANLGTDQIILKRKRTEADKMGGEKLFYHRKRGISIPRLKPGQKLRRSFFAHGDGFFKRHQNIHRKFARKIMGGI